MNSISKCAMTSAPITECNQHQRPATRAAAMQVSYQIEVDPRGHLLPSKRKASLRLGAPSRRGMRRFGPRWCRQTLQHQLRGKQQYCTQASPIADSAGTAAAEYTRTRRENSSDLTELLR